MKKQTIGHGVLIFAMWHLVFIRCTDTLNLVSTRDMFWTSFGIK